MARIAFAATLGQSLGEGRFSTSAGASTAPLTPATTADDALATVVGADQTAVEAAIAVLEADAASPTQGHVNSLRTVWNTMKTDGATAKTATAAAKTAGAAANVVLDIDTAVATTQNSVRAAVREIMQALKGSGLAS